MQFRTYDLVFVCKLNAAWWRRGTRRFARFPFQQRTDSDLLRVHGYLNMHSFLSEQLYLPSQMRITSAMRCRCNTSRTQKTGHENYLAFTLWMQCKIIFCPVTHHPRELVYICSPPEPVLCHSLDSTTKLCPVTYLFIISTILCALHFESNLYAHFILFTACSRIYIWDLTSAWRAWCI